MKLLFAFDSFKGTFSAAEVCSLTAAMMARCRSDWKLHQLPLADGGEGTAETLVKAVDGNLLTATGITGPLPSMQLNASYGWLPQQKTAIVEMAMASGLPLLTPIQRNPLKTTTFGTGQLLQAAVTKGAEKILLTLGGSATVDGGTGAATALGWRFLDRSGHEVPPGAEHLLEIDRIVPPDSTKLPVVQALCDVDNPLCGPLGAATVYGPQKGAGPEMIPLLEDGLYHLAKLIKKQFNKDVLTLPGAGAAGGFGAGAVAFFNAELVSGFRAVAEVVKLDEVLEAVDCVVTGEGKLDEQSLQGKVVSGVIARARTHEVPVAVIAGRVDLDPAQCRAAGIQWVVSCTEAKASEEDALRHARSNLEQAVQKLLTLLEKR